MKKNMGSSDRMIRIVIAAVFLGLYYTGTVSGTWGIVLLVLAGVFVITSLFAVCPLYVPLGLNTGSTKES